MIKKFRESEIRQFLWGFGIFSVLWILGIIFAGKIHFIDTVELPCGNPILSGIFPFVFSTVLVGISCFSKRCGTNLFFKTSYILATIPIVSNVLLMLFAYITEWNDAFSLVFGLPMLLFMLLGIPAMSAVNAFGYGSLFFLAFGIFVLSLIISMVCYMTIKEKISDRPGIWC